MGGVSVCVRRCPTFPPGLGSIIGAGRLSFRVRDGSGRFPVAMSAVTLFGVFGGGRLAPVVGVVGCVPLSQVCFGGGGDVFVVCVVARCVVFTIFPGAGVLFPGWGLL